MVWHYFGHNIQPRLRNDVSSYTSNYVQGNYSARNHIYKPMTYEGVMIQQKPKGRK